MAKAVEKQAEETAPEAPAPSEEKTVDAQPQEPKVETPVESTQPEKKVSESVPYERFKQVNDEKERYKEQLAQKAGTTKNYISRIENNASDIRLSTLWRIIRKGLDGHLKLSLDI